MSNGNGTATDTEKGEVVQQLQALNRTLSARATQGDTGVTRHEFARMAGLQYDDERDIWEVAGYPEQYTYQEGKERYERQHIASRIVDLPAQTTWRRRPIVRAEGRGQDDERSDFGEAWDELVDRLGLMRQFDRADRMASIGEYSVLLIGFAGDTDRGMKGPAPESNIGSPEDVLYVQPFSEEDVEIEGWVTDHESPRYRKPKSYRIDTSGDEGEGFIPDDPQQEVHWTRVVHVAEDSMNRDVFGRPRLRRVINPLRDLEKVQAATGEAFWQQAVRILQAKVDENVSKDSLDEVESDLDDQLQNLVHDLRRHFWAKGIELEYLDSDPADPTSTIDSLLDLIASGVETPKPILMGRQRGDLASKEDARAWLGHIEGRQQRFAEPIILRQFIDRLMDAGALEQTRYTVEWPSLQTVTDEERAQINERRANAAKALTPTAGDPTRLVEITEEGELRLLPMEADGSVDQQAGVT